MILLGSILGSILGPLLFIVFINDISSSVGSPKSILYVDDTNLIVTGKSYMELLEKGQLAVNSIKEWCLSNGLKLKSDKTLIIEFCVNNACVDRSMLLRIDNRSIKQVNGTKFLGVHFDNKLTWVNHINTLKTKLSSYSFLIQLRNTASVEILRLLYFELIQSQVSYGLLYWGNSSHTREIFVCQKLIVRLMLGLVPRDHCRQTFKDLGLLTLPGLHFNGFDAC